MKMLATGGAYADEVWIGNLTPIDDKYKAESITAALPLKAPGLSLWAPSLMPPMQAARRIIR